MALACELAAKVLWWGKRLLENTQERLDVVQREMDSPGCSLSEADNVIIDAGNLDLNLPVLFYPCRHDHCRRRNASSRQILRGVLESGVLTCLGAYGILDISGASLILAADPGHRVYRCLDCNVLPDSILRSDPE